MIYWIIDRLMIEWYYVILAIHGTITYTLLNKGDFKSMAMTNSQKEYEKKRMKQCKTYAIKYSLYLSDENRENERLKRYLEQSGISANSYIKGLIKADLDSKNVPYNE